MGDEDLISIAEGLAMNRTLRTLRLETYYDLSFTFKFIPSFARAMESNFTITELKLPRLVNWWKRYHPHTPVDPGEVERTYAAIDAALARNQRFAARPGLLLCFRRAHEAHRDARLVFRAAAEGRPLELQRRLVLGKLAGGPDRLVDGMTALDAARSRDQDECVRILEERAKSVIGGAVLEFK